MTKKYAKFKKDDKMCLKMSLCKTNIKLKVKTNIYVVVLRLGAYLGS